MKFAKSAIVTMLLCSSVASAALAEAKWSFLDMDYAQWSSATDAEIVNLLKLRERCTDVQSINQNSAPRAQTILAIAYQDGICVEQDSSNAEIWFASAAKSGDARAMLSHAAYKATRAQSYAELKDIFELIQKLADSGDARAKASLAFAYGDGVPGLVERDNGKALKLMTESIRGGFWPTLLLYDFMTAASDGAKPDALTPQEITAFWKKAAETGNLAAIREYAKRLEKGEGVPVDTITAAKLRRLIDQKGNAAVENDIGAAFASFLVDWKIKESEAARRDRLLAEANAGKSDAMYDLASLLEYGGEGVAADEAAAFGWYKKAAELGNGVAVYAATERLLDPTSPYFDEGEGIRLLRRQMQNDTANGGEYRRKLAAHLATTTSSYRDFAGAQKLLRDGIGLGDPYVIEALAWLYTPADDDTEETAKFRDSLEAIKLYEKFLALPEGAESFDTMAHLASLYSMNRFDLPDGAEKANSWVQKSAAGQSALGNVYLGDFLFYGLTNQVPDYAKAKKYWLKAQELAPDWELNDRIAVADEAINEDRNTITAAAMEALGLKYDEGIDRPLIPSKAKYWFQRAVDAGTKNRDTLWRLATLYDLDGPAGKSEPLWRQLSVGNDDFVAEAKARVAEFDAGRAAAKPRPAPTPAPQPKAVATAAPPVGKAWGNTKVPTGKEFICEMTVWSGLKSLGIVSRDRQPKYDDAFRLEFLSRTQVRISGADKLKNGVRNIVVQGSIARISDPYSVSTGILGETHWNVIPFEFDLADYSFEEVWDNSWGMRTIKKGSCD